MMIQAKTHDHTKLDVVAQLLSIHRIHLVKIVDCSIMKATQDCIKHMILVPFPKPESTSQQTSRTFTA